jgi:hypothetical protein
MGAPAAACGGGALMANGPAPIDLAREPMQAFTDRRVEAFARSRAGGDSISRSAEKAGLSRSSGQKLEQSEAVAARVQELQAQTAEFTDVTLVAIMAQLWTNAQRAADNRDFKASNQALGQLVPLVEKHGGSAAGRTLGPGGQAKSMRDELRDELGPKPYLPEPQPSALEELDQAPLDTRGEEVARVGNDE